MKSNAGIVIKRLQEKLKQKVNELPKVIMNEGQKAFTENFKNEGFEGKKWKDVVNKKKKYGRPILVGRTRQLINSVRTSGKVSNSHLIKWATYVPYAAIHNEGGVIRKKARNSILNFNKKGKFQRQRTEKQRSRTSYSQKVRISAYTIVMPQRKFMGIGEKTRRRFIEKAAKAMKL